RSGFDRVGVDFATARLQRGNLHATTRGDTARAVLVLQCIEGRPDHVVGVRGAEGFRDDVLHAQRFENGAHRAAGDDAGTGRGGAEYHLPGAVLALDVVMQRATLAKRHADERALRRVG